MHAPPPPRVAAHRRDEVARLVGHPQREHAAIAVTGRVDAREVDDGRGRCGGSCADLELGDVVHDAP